MPSQSIPLMCARSALTYFHKCLAASQCIQQGAEDFVDEVEKGGGTGVAYSQPHDLRSVRLH